MFNWIKEDKSLIAKAVSAAMGEFESLVDCKEIITANYWLDSTHNIFGIVDDNGLRDVWIELHYELYDSAEDLIGDLAVIDTRDTSRDAIEEQITEIVKMYYGE